MEQIQIPTKAYLFILAGVVLISLMASYPTYQADQKLHALQSEWVEGYKISYSGCTQNNCWFAPFGITNSNEIFIFHKTSSFSNDNPEGIDYKNANKFHYDQAIPTGTTGILKS